MLYILALCHTVLIEEKNGIPTFSASSPDELALINAAKFFNVNFVKRDKNNIITLDLGNGEQETFRLLDVIEFTSARKMMSVII